MAITRNGKYYPGCLKCGKGLRGEYRILAHCSRCILRFATTENVRCTQRPPDLEARIRYYRQRAAKGLPLFDPPFSEDVA